MKTECHKCTLHGVVVYSMRQEHRGDHRVDEGVPHITYEWRIMVYITACHG